MSAAAEALMVLDTEHFRGVADAHGVHLGCHGLPGGAGPLEPKPIPAPGRQPKVVLEGGLAGRQLGDGYRDRLGVLG
jgi:hypothetical protein